MSGNSSINIVWSPSRGANLIYKVFKRFLPSCYLTTTTTSCSMRSMTTKVKQRVTLFLNPELLKHAKAQAIIDELTLTALVETALVKYLPKETIIKKTQI